MQIDGKRRIYSVSEITFFIREILEEQFPLIWIRGEVSNLSRPLSGHIYFTLKDNNALISAVWFKSNHGFTKNISSEDLRDGKEVICAGKITAYPQKGVYQIIVEFIEDAGIGNLYLELELLKRKLKEKGYFDEGRKRPIPLNPKKVAVITAKKGAAIQDFLKIAREKGMEYVIRIYPSSVQGAEAEREIVNMIETANREQWAEVLVIIRGGGSFEDLHVFNSEKIAHAIYNSKLPVVTGIGHEIDYTIADMVADYRCATPTHVANFLWENKETYIQQIDELSISLYENIGRLIRSKEKSLRINIREMKANSPLYKFQKTITILYKLVKDLFVSMDSRIELEKIKSEKYSYRSVSKLKEKLLETEIDLSLENKNMVNSINKKINAFSSFVHLMFSKMESLNPKIQLKRGFTYIKLKTGDIVKSSKELKKGDMIDIVFYDGEKEAVVK